VDSENRPPRLRFPKKARLAESSEFAKVRTEGKAQHGKHMLLGVLGGIGDTPTRVGFVTSRKVGGAVTRNLIRRRLREIVRIVRPELKPGFWIVIVAKPNSAKATLSKLREEWMTLAKRAGIFR
jgi:ribonuclease P protein component